MRSLAILCLCVLRSSVPQSSAMKPPLSSTTIAVALSFLFTISVKGCGGDHTHTHLHTRLPSSENPSSISAACERTTHLSVCHRALFHQVSFILRTPEPDLAAPTVKNPSAVVTIFGRSARLGRSDCMEPEMLWSRLLHAAGYSRPRRSEVPMGCLPG